MSIELSSERIPASVVWIREATVGLKFDQNIDLGELFAGRKQRHGFRPRPPRLEIPCKASVRVGKTYYTVDVHDISLGGIKVEPIEEYCVGKPVTVVVESLRPIKGEVRWYSERKAGIVFDKPLDFDELSEWVGKRLELASLKASYKEQLTLPIFAPAKQERIEWPIKSQSSPAGASGAPRPCSSTSSACKSVESGYTGGQAANPTYKQVCGGDTGHAEAIRITFDPDQISYGDLLDIFFATHDRPSSTARAMTSARNIARRSSPRTPSRSAKAREAIARATPTRRSHRDYDRADGHWYPAEDYHQDYWSGEGQRNPYCLAAIPPKLQKLRKSFQARLKSAKGPRRPA